MATTPTDDPTTETYDYVVSDPTTEPCGVISHAPIMSRSFPVAIASTNSFKVTRGFGGVVENAKVNVGKLYLRQIFGGPGANQSDVIRPNAVTGLGKTSVNNWGIYDGPTSKANLVANGHGMQTFAGQWSNWLTLVFVGERFEGSTLQVMGANDEEEENDWAIVGGTGEFEMARGIINRRVYRSTATSLTQELTMEFYCRMKVVPAPTKRGPWGGNGEGSLWEMEGKSQRLESVTIYHAGAVHGFQFSYMAEDGQIRTTQSFGRIINDPNRKTEINFGPTEFVKQIKGAKYSSGQPEYLAKFEIVTNRKTYGPFGVDSAGTTDPFGYTLPEGETVVGFFVTTVDVASNIGIRKIGVYTI